jgi:predicted nucleic acid-binding protein
MKVVSNSSPICYLLLIGQIHLLPALFGQIDVPEAVYLELTNAGAPDIVRDWITHPPSWLQVHQVSEHADPTLDRLHAGEREAIALAQQLAADLILIDEKAARGVALEAGLRVSGLLGVLDVAATQNMVDLTTAIGRLISTSFRASPRLLKSLLDKHAHEQV